MSPFCKPDMAIKQINENGSRYYTGEVNGRKLKGKSVTTIIGAFEDKSWLERWWYAEGKKLASDGDTDEEILALGKAICAEITTEAAGHGTSQHSQAEFMLTSGLKPSETSLPCDLADFLHKNVQPYSHQLFPSQIGCEVPILYEKHNNVVGGTTDLVGEINLTNLFSKEDKNYLSGVEKVLVVGDYKFPKKPKYDRDNIKYFLQLAAYRAGLKYTYDLQVDWGLLIVSPRSNNKLYLWLFEKKTLDYYQEVFDEMLYLHATDNVELFTWNSFVDKALKEDCMKGVRLTHVRENV